jgi:hypothetical protein
MGHIFMDMDFKEYPRDRRAALAACFLTDFLRIHGVPEDVARNAASAAAAWSSTGDHWRLRLECGRESLALRSLEADAEQLPLDLRIRCSEVPL